MIDRRHPRAVLWDMDGTIVDTEPYWIAAEYDIVERHGGTWSDEHARALVGSDLLDSGRYMRLHGGVDREPHEIVEMLLDRVVESIRREVPWRPGARELLADLRAVPVPTALVTMSWRRFAHEVVDALPADSFDVVVVGDDVERGKPHPEPYLLAARRLGVDPAECLAIEDSPTGVASALAAGCMVVAVPHVVDVPASADPDVPLRVLPTLAGVSTADLAEVMMRAAGRRGRPHPG
jgi:HAD superfamily hydrolase (TIGR01509 family)